MPIRSMSELDLANKRVLIREDLNVPVKDGRVTGDARLNAALPTLRLALERGAGVMVMSHLGRPTEGADAASEPQFSLAPVAQRLSELLGREVALISDWIDGVEISPGELVLLENVRWLRGETSNDESLARRMAALCDVFVMDAFGTAHRAQASTQGVARFAPQACGGPLLIGELDALGRALEAPRRPMIAIVGGAKVSTKLNVLERLSQIGDRLIVGGGIANTFIAAAGYGVGRSLHEPDLLERAGQIAARVEIPLPFDVVCARDLDADAQAVLRKLGEVREEEMILDIGPETARHWATSLESAGTILWNGPVGVFEYDQFGEGTRSLAEAIARSPAYSLAGGGETLSAIDKYGVAEAISYISTGGGAFLEFVEGRTLPAVAILEQRGGE